MTEFLSAQLNIVAAMQRSLASSPALVEFWKTLSKLGSEQFFLLLLPIIFWCFSARRGLQLGFLVIMGEALNFFAKMLVLWPRPYWFENGSNGSGVDLGYGMPSSHAQNALVLWLFLAMLLAPRYGRGLSYGVAVAMILLISLSRIALGVHFPVDIVGGWLLGALTLQYTLKYWDRVERKLKRRKHFDQLITGVVVTSVFLCLTLILNDLSQYASPLPGVDQQHYSSIAIYLVSLKGIALRSGAVLGYMVGMAYHYRRTRWKVMGSLPVRLGRLVVGLAGVILIWGGIGMLVPEGTDALWLACEMLRYCLVAIWVLCLGPRLFMQFRWTRGGPKLVAPIEFAVVPLAASE